MFRYSLYTRRVVFNPVLDELNNFETVVCGNKGEVFKVNLAGYRILKIIDESLGIDFDSLLEKIKIQYDFKTDNQVLRNFLDQMENVGIVKKENG